MRKFFFFAILLAALPMMAQEDNYPRGIDQEYSYTLDGIQREVVTTGMIRQIVTKEASEVAHPLYILVQRWYDRGWEGNPNGYGYDTIAQFRFENHKAVLSDDKRLDSEEYSNVLWRVNWLREELAPNDTIKSIIFNYYGDKFLSYNLASDTSYAAYAGRPYRLNQVSNPLFLPLTYKSEKPSVATVNEKNGEITVVGVGETEITASFAGNDEIQPLSASWKLVVKEGDHFELSIITPERVEKPWGSGTYWAFDIIEVTNDNCNDIYGDGKLSFDIETRTLTMNNYQRIYSQEEDNSMGWTDWLDYESGPLPLNIKIVGNCAIRHNSAGLFCGYDLTIVGDGEEKSRLTLEGRFPQLSAGNKITIDGVQVHALASTPHPLMMCETLRVEDNSYYEAYMNIEVGEGEDPREWGAMVGQLNYVELGENTIMLSKDVHVENNTFVDGNGRTALRVEIGPKMEEVVAGNVNFGTIELTDDPTGTLIDGILYTLQAEWDRVNKEEGCLEISSTMTAKDVQEIIEELTPGSAAFSEQFHGLSILLPVGKGNINIDLQTLGVYQLAVQIGTNAPTLFTQATKGTVQIPYDLNVATFAFIYAVIPGAGDGMPAWRRAKAADTTGNVKLYSLSLSNESQGIENVQDNNVQCTKVMKDGVMYLMHNGNIYSIQGTRLQ